jgi:hypothetical protein
MTPTPEQERLLEAPWTAQNMVAPDGGPMSAHEIGIYVANNVRFTREQGGYDHFLFVSDGAGKDVCLVGNGPRGPENARLIASAPELLEALEQLADVFAYDGEDSMYRFERLAEMFRKDTGYLAPGKDPGMASCQPDGEELRRIYDGWFNAKVQRARTAIRKAMGE